MLKCTEMANDERAAAASTVGGEAESAAAVSRAAPGTSNQASPAPEAATPTPTSGPLAVSDAVKKRMRFVSTVRVKLFTG